MQKIEDEFVEKLFADKDVPSDDNLVLVPEESPEVKKARANVDRILNDMLKKQKEELDANKFDVLEVQNSFELNVGDAKVTDNYLSKFDASEYYKIRLNNFEGPLDLLLYLIKDSKLEIENIKLASITEQYLDYMKDIDKVDMEKAAEFIEVAATLVEIKSKAMIPQEQEKIIDENDPEWLLLQRLKEYKLYKEASEKMKKQEVVNQMYKLPDEKVNDFRNVLKDMNIQGLINAFTSMMSKAAVREVVAEERTIVRDRWTVEEKIFEIRTLISTQERIKFEEMVGEDFTRGEVITLFMAMLELLKLQIINVKQDEMFGEIEIIKGENFDGQFGQNTWGTFVFVWWWIRPWCYYGKIAGNTKATRQSNRGFKAKIQWWLWHKYDNIQGQIATLCKPKVCWWRFTCFKSY